MVGVGGGSGRINQWKCTFPRFVIGLVLPLLLPILTIWFWLDHKRNVSGGGVGTLFSLDHKVYAFYYDSDSDSVASENQPLVAHTEARCVWLVVKGVTWGANQSQSRIKPNVTQNKTTRNCKYQFKVILCLVWFAGRSKVDLSSATVSFIKGVLGFVADGLSVITPQVIRLNNVWLKPPPPPPPLSQKQKENKTKETPFSFSKSKLEKETS